MFSIVIPLYNKELSIGNTIQSVLNQTYQDYEIIIVNDGSTDNSLHVVEQINDSRIRIITKPNGGVSSARNRGIKESKRDWIAFLDGDDLWKTNHLNEIFRMMNVFPNKKIYVTSYKYSDDRKIYRLPRKNDIFIIDNYFKEAIYENLIWSSIIVVHKSCFKTVGVFNEKINRGEDLDMWARLAREFIIIKSITTTGIYRITAENRACNSNQDIDNFFLPTLKNYSTKYEQKYMMKIISDLFFEMLSQKKFKNISFLIIKYHIYTLKILLLFFLNILESRRADNKLRPY